MAPAASAFASGTPSRAPATLSSSASARKSRITCPRVIPSVRHMPISRRRVMTATERVLWIKNSPTSRAMPESMVRLK